MATKIGDARSGPLASEAARWLCGPTWGHGSSGSGLHAGEAGVGLFLLRHATGPGPTALADMAVTRARRLATPEPGFEDVVDGAAGSLLFLAELSRLEGTDKLRRSAEALADRLVQSALPHGPSGGLVWLVRGLTPADRIPYLGLLHGAAGIGLALLRAGELLERQDFVDAANRVAKLLLATATLQDSPAGETATWPRALTGPDQIQSAHCHGAGGIGQYLIRLWRHTRDDRQLQLACSAGRTIEARVPAGSTFCHGSLGDASLLLDLYQATGDPHFLHSADHAARRAYVDMSERAPNGLNDAGLMLGQAGMAAVAVRLTDPEKRPDLILDPAVSATRQG